MLLDALDGMAISSAERSGTPIEQEDTGPGGAYARLADVGQAPEWFQEDVE